MNRKELRKVGAIVGLVPAAAALAHHPAAGAAVAGDIELSRLVCDAPGDDAQNLNGEVLVLRNTGASPVNIAGWTVQDEAGATYTFPEGRTIAPGAGLRLFTGSGTEGPRAAYWGRGAPVWNNDGDRAVLRNRNGRRVASTPCTDAS